MSSKVLFILKCRGLSYEKNDNTIEIDNLQNNYCLSSGLLNSASFVNDMLNNIGIESNIVQVIDNNCIDKYVTKYKPTHVIIEALWVVPEKFNILRKLHPRVKWIIRLHSEFPFLSNEGNAIDWVLEYLKQPNIFIAPNTYRMVEDIMTLVDASYGAATAEERIIYLPNYYHSEFKQFEHNDRALHISSFGAIRPLKNQLIQALAAIKYAGTTDKKLFFHINSGRIEHGNNVLKNIRALFSELDTTKYELIEHSWMSHNIFLNVVRNMNVCLQVSYSETFNITTADAVSQKIPVVVSDEINWVSSLFHADCSEVDDIVFKIKRALFWGKIGTFLNSCGLKRYNRKSVRVWKNYLND